MEFIPQTLSGLILIKPRVFTDPRGFFLESYHEQRYAAAGTAWELVGISGFKLGKAAVIEQDFCQGIIQRKLLQHIFVRGRHTAGRFFDDGQA